MTKQTVLKYSFVFLVFLISFFGTRFIINNYINKQKPIESLIFETNQNCPKKISDGIILDSVTIKNKNFNYFYSLVYENKDNWNDADFQEFMKPNLINTYQKSEEKSILNEYSFNLIYHYQDGFQEPLSKIIITPKEYQK